MADKPAEKKEEPAKPAEEKKPEPAKDDVKLPEGGAAKKTASTEAKTAAATLGVKI